MAPRKRGKKVAKKAPAKQQMINSMVEEFDSKTVMHIKEMETDIEEGCDQISNYYDNILQSINPEYLPLTLDEISELGNKTPPRGYNGGLHVSALETKLQTVQKKALSVSRSSSRSRLNSIFDKTHILNSSVAKCTVTKLKKQKLSTAAHASTPVSGLGGAGPSHLKRRVLSTMQHMPTPLQKKRFQTAVTPSSKIGSIRSRMLVTPKFDPKAPIPQMMLRKPRAGEIIMSLSGSPIMNPVSIQSRFAH